VLVKWVQTVWLLAKDILLTGVGLALIVTQIFARQPSDVLLMTGLALTIPSVASHAGTLLGAQSGGGHGQQEHSPSSSAPGLPPSSAPPDGPDEPA
jgi:hypothetical protein